MKLSDQKFIIIFLIGAGTRSTRQRTVLGSSQSDNMLPPPSTAKVQRKRKVVRGYKFVCVYEDVKLYMVEAFNSHTV